MIEDVEQEIQKLRYHIRLMSEAIDWSNEPVNRLIVSMNWDEYMIDKVHDIFEKYDNKLTNNEAINWMDFEKEVRGLCRISYQMVKLIVLAFYDNQQWVRVCNEYAKSFKKSIPVELKRIAVGKDFGV